MKKVLALYPETADDLRAFFGWNPDDIKNKAQELAGEEVEIRLLSWMDLFSASQDEEQVEFEVVRKSSGVPGEPVELSVSLRSRKV